MAKCPYCDKVVSLGQATKDECRSVNKEVKGGVKKEVMYSCPHCERVLGFAFFFGGLVTGRP